MRRARPRAQCSSPAGRTGWCPTRTAAASSITWQGRGGTPWCPGSSAVVAPLGWTARWRVYSDLYRWLPVAGGGWHRVARGARLVAPRVGGGRLSVIALVPGGNRPALPVPPAPDGGGASATWGEVVPSPDGRWVAGTRNANGHWALLRWPADTTEAGRVLRESAGVIADPTWTPAGALLFVPDPTGL